MPRNRAEVVNVRRSMPQRMPGGRLMRRIAGVNFGGAGVGILLIKGMGICQSSVFCIAIMHGGGLVLLRSGSNAQHTDLSTSSVEC